VNGRFFSRFSVGGTLLPGHTLPVATYDCDVTWDSHEMSDTKYSTPELLKLFCSATPFSKTFFYATPLLDSLEQCLSTGCIVHPRVYQNFPGVYHRDGVYRGVRGVCS